METIDIIKKENEELKQKILLLENENIELKNHLKKYTNGNNNKKTSIYQINNISIF